MNSINPDFPFKIDERQPTEKPVKAWGTDSGPFAVKGVPTVGLNCADTKGYDFSYQEIWHTERDQYDKSIKEYEDQAAVETAVLVYGIAGLDHMLSREGYYIEKPIEQPKKKKDK